MSAIGTDRDLGDSTVGNVVVSGIRGGRNCAGRPLPSGGRGRRFKSSHSDQISTCKSVTYITIRHAPRKSVLPAEAPRKPRAEIRAIRGISYRPLWPDPPRACVRGTSPLPPQPSAGSPCPPKRRRPDREAQRGFRVPSPPDARPGAGGFPPPGGLGPIGRKGGPGQTLNPPIVQRLQWVRGNSPECPLGADPGLQRLTRGGARDGAASPRLGTRPKPLRNG
jgi:hypothetical protein